MSIVAQGGSVLNCNDQEIYGDDLVVIGNNNRIYGNRCHVRGKRNFVDGVHCVVSGGHNECAHDSLHPMLVYGRNSLLQTAGVQAILNPTKKAAPKKRKRRVKINTV